MKSKQNEIAFLIDTYVLLANRSQNIRFHIFHNTVQLNERSFGELQKKT